MNQDITIEELSQHQTDQILRTLPSKTFNTAFHEEKDRKERGEVLWACPPIKNSQTMGRNYYLLKVSSVNRLLVGINYVFNISSFAKIADEPRHFAANCLKKLIEEILVPECKCLTPVKPSIISQIITDEGKRVMENLKNNLPKGVKRIDISSSILGWKATIVLD